jgi:hypothetical protein
LHDLASSNVQGEKKKCLLLFYNRHVSRQNSEIEKEEKQEQHVMSEVKIGSQKLMTLEKNLHQVDTGI